MKRLGDYELLRELGDGFCGSVMLARKDGEKPVAVKFPSPEKFAKSPKVGKLLAHEFAILQMLRHPYIITALEYQDLAPLEKEGVKGEVPFLALEVVPNGEVCSLVCEHGQFPEISARFFFKQLAETLNFINSRGFAHRDVKPENLLIDESWNLKLIDFAFAVEANKIETALVGTPGYIAPEMLAKKGYDPAKVDVFAAGVVLFVMVRGSPPFNDTVPTDPHYSAFKKNNAHFWTYHRHKDPKAPCSPSFVDLVNRMLEPDPAKRIDIQRVLSHEYLANLPSDDLARQAFREYLGKP